MVERMAAKSVAAASNASGLAITNDIAHPPPTRDNPAAPEPSMRMAGISYCDPPPSVGVFARFVAAQRHRRRHHIGDGWWLTRVVEGDGRGTVRTVVRPAHPAGLLRRPVTQKTVVLSVALLVSPHMFEISHTPDPTELCRSDDGALVAAIEDCAPPCEAAASARRLSAIADLTPGAPRGPSGPTGRVTSGTAPRRWLRR